MRRWLRVVLGLAAAGLLALAVFIVPTLWGKPWSIDHFFLRELVYLALDHPVMLSYARPLDRYGLDFYSDELGDYSLEGIARDRARIPRALDGLAAYDDDDLSAEQRRSADTARWFLELLAAGDPYLLHAYPVNQFSGTQTFLPDFLVNVHQVNDAGDAREYLARLAAVDTALDQIGELMGAADEAGIRPPDFVLAEVRQGLAGFAETPPVESPLYEKLVVRLPELDDVSDADRQAMLAEAAVLLQERVGPGYARLDAVVAEIATRADADAGLWKHPDGDAAYRWALRYHTTTALTPDEIHAIGLAEVARIHEQMREILAGEGISTDDPIAALRAASKEERFLFSDDDAGRAAILAEHQAIIDETWELLPRYFGRLPEAPVVVERVPAFREEGSAGAYYNPPPLDGSKPGVFYKNLANVEETTRFGMRTLTYHEAVPGHHLQISIALENEDLPFFRRFLPSTAFIEGWALYAERLAAEEGLLPTAWDHLGQLQAENFRAVRLVVDTGIHAKRWTREQAIDWMERNTGMAHTDVVREIERYVVAPGQATAYKIGQLEILRLRDEARAALGPRFDLRAFHDTLLAGGALPLELLEQVVHEWVAAEAAKEPGPTGS
jgi:uncharacterized protein (DUF885 family)